MKISYVSLLSTFIIVCYCKEDSESVLKSVIVVFRHGERNIIETYPSDPYANLSYWKEGFGQLTNQGKMRHYLLGQWFRRRYNGFLPEEYSPKYIRVDSTDIDRTLMSASAHLAGLYIPPASQVFNPSLEWQPIPIHTKPTNEDAVLAGGKKCPYYDQLYNYIAESSPELEGVRKEVEEVLDYASQHTGMVLKGFEDVLKIYDILKVEQVTGLKLPEWSKKVFPEQLTRLVGTRFALETFNQELARLKLGLLLKEFVTHFKNIILNLKNENGNPYPKYRIFSGHDFTVANILNVFGSYDKVPPPYGSALILELRENQVSKNHFINVLYKNSIDAQPTKVNLAECEFNCDFEEFQKILKPVMTDSEQWNKDCNKTLHLGVSKECKRTWFMKKIFLI